MEVNENGIIPVVETKATRNNYSITMSNGYETTLRRNTDFGMIKKKDGAPISTKPTLFASGKDKILHGLGLVYLTEITDRHCDFEKGVFYYEAKATAYYNNTPVRSAYGSANTVEKSGGFATGWDLSNTAIKKAVKRAEVALAIKLANVSSMFAQDLEDTTIEEEAKHIQSENDYISPKQVQRIFAIASNHGITTEKAKAMLKELGYDSSKSIPIKDYDMVCEKFQKADSKE